MIGFDCGETVTTDNRRKSPKEQLELRRKVVSMRLEGKSNREISEALGYCYSHISTIWRRYQKNGVTLDELEPLARGRKTGEKMIVSQKHERRIKNILLNHTPADSELGLQLDSLLWDSDAIHKLFSHVVGRKIPKRTVSEYRKRWGLTPQPPYAHATGQNKKDYRKWRKNEYPEILARLRKEKAEIHWLDCVDSSEASGGENQLAANHSEKNTGAKRSFVMVSTVTNRGKFRFMLLPNPLTAGDFYKFLVRLGKSCERNIFLISYNDIAHHSKDIYRRTCPDSPNHLKIELLYLPSDLPEHNPSDDMIADIVSLKPRPPRPSTSEKRGPMAGKQTLITNLRKKGSMNGRAKKPAGFKRPTKKTK
jgi:transposase